MTQQGKKTLNIFKSLRNELAEETKKSGEPEVLNLKGMMVNVRAHMVGKGKLWCLPRKG